MKAREAPKNNMRKPKMLEPGPPVFVQANHAPINAKKTVMPPKVKKHQKAISFTV